MEWGQWWWKYFNYGTFLMLNFIDLLYFCFMKMILLVNEF